VRWGILGLLATVSFVWVQNIGCDIRDALGVHFFTVPSIKKD
jgi:hypothetical protein